jgi:quercetin dioxygenase-like cupin family protein
MPEPRRPRRPPREALPEATTRQLLEALAPVEDAAPAGTRIRDRLMARIGAGPSAPDDPAPPRGTGPAPSRPTATDAVVATEPAAAPPAAAGFFDLRADAGWQLAGTGVAIKLLGEDDQAVTTLWRLEPGALLPAHDHTDGPEECLVVSGDAWLNGLRYAAGDWHVAQRGTRHGAVRTERGCLLFIRSVREPASAAALTA